MTADRTLVMTLCTLSMGLWVSGYSFLRPSLANTSPQIQPSTSTSPSPTISKNSTPADRAIPRYKHIFTIVALVVQRSPEKVTEYRGGIINGEKGRKRGSIVLAKNRST